MDFLAGTGVCTPATKPLPLQESQSKYFYATAWAMVCCVSCRAKDHLIEVSLRVSFPTATMQQIEGEAFNKLVALLFDFGHK